MTLLTHITSTPFCNLSIQLSRDTLIRMEFTDKQPTSKPSNHALLNETLRQLKCYFSDPFFEFHLPLREARTPFQIRMRQLMQAIPTGKVKTYKQCAEQLKTSARAIGNACRANDFPIIIPCHRIVAVNGMGGFSGKTAGKMLELKIKLLKHEKAVLPCLV